MRATEVKRLALLIIFHDVEASLDISDEWLRHPETDEPFTREELEKVRAQGREFCKWLETQVSK